MREEETPKKMEYRKVPKDAVLKWNGVPVWINELGEAGTHPKNWPYIDRDEAKASEAESE